VDAYRTRVGAVASALRKRDLDALLVSAPANVRYLTGYTGTNGVALVHAGESDHRFFTDFRYEAQAAEEVPELFEREIAPVDLLGLLAERLGGKPDGRGPGDRVAEVGGDAPTNQGRGADEGAPGGAPSRAWRTGGRLGFDEQHVTVAQHDRLLELLERSWELAPAAGIVEDLREVKDEDEVRRIEAAAELADEALSRVLEGGLAGRTERELALELELGMRRLGAEGPSFPTIVAAGHRGALPHAQPQATQIAAGELVTIDWGAFHNGYCSDCTRTFASGTPRERQREIYELVLEAQAQGLAALAAGLTGEEVDAVVRELIERAGHGEHFGHGLGHGVGIEVHEGPRLSRFRGSARLRAGNVVTVEPGVYLPGELGVRIEDLVVLTAEGKRVLSSLPKALTVVS
jgi:Xaa-Pro aminopeptidase